MGANVKSLLNLIFFSLRKTHKGYCEGKKLDFIEKKILNFCVVDFISHVNNPVKAFSGIFNCNVICSHFNS